MEYVDERLLASYLSMLRAECSEDNDRYQEFVEAKEQYLNDKSRENAKRMIELSMESQITNKELIELYDMVIQMTRRFLPSLGVFIDCDDIASDSFCRLLKYKGYNATRKNARGNRANSFAYVSTVIRNELLQMFKRQNRSESLENIYNTEELEYNSFYFVDEIIDAIKHNDIETVKTFVDENNIKNFLRIIPEEDLKDLETAIKIKEFF